VLHNLGGTIIVIGRNSSKLDKLESMLDYGITDTDDADGSSNNRKSRKRLHKRIIPILADFTDLNSVSTAADTIKSKFKTIDLLINNAGMTYPTNFYPNYYGDDMETSTPQGYDRVFTVNYLSHFLLTEKLLPSLQRSKKSGGARIVQIASSMHYMVNGEDLLPTIDTDMPPLASMPAASYSQALTSYGNSKLAQICHMRSLNANEREKSESSVKVVSLCPSFVATNIIGAEHNFHSLLDVFAFSSDGYGLTSILHALFHPDAGMDESSDYVNNINMGMLGIYLLHYIPDYVLNRLHNVGMLVMLGLQKFVAQGGQFVDSSQDSYDVGKRDALYEWSKVAVAPWLKK